MNIYIPIEVKEKHPTFDFRGKPWNRGGLTWIHGFHKTLQTTFRFCIELECGADLGMYEFICKNGYFG